MLIIVGVYINNLTLAFKNQDELEQLKSQLIQEFNIKDLGEAITIIEWEITQDIHIRSLKIDQKTNIQDFLESEEMCLYHSIVLPIKVG